MPTKNRRDMTRAEELNILVDKLQRNIAANFIRLRLSNTRKEVTELSNKIFSDIEEYASRKIELSRC